MISDYIRLVRAPMLVTALADPIAGYCLARPAPDGAVAPDYRNLLPVGLASLCLYAAGMVFNDCADVVRDRTLHPERPLASGRVPFTRAFTLGVGLALVALLAAQTVNLGASAAALGLALGILLYNGVTKRHWLAGAMTMGALRAGNALLGVFAALPERGAMPLDPLPFLAALFLYGTLLTILSGLEEPPPRPRRFGALVVAANALFPDRSLASLILTLLLAAALLYKGLGMLKEFDPGLVSTLVKIGVLGFIPLDAAAAAGTGHMAEGIFLLVLLIPPIAFLSGFVRLPGFERAN
jgi:4-hydroxybenzoate polyprenyltransferase